MMQGEIASAVVEVSGLLTTAGIKWMRGSGTAALGPIPLVNVWYTLLLPSGASYRFSIHRSRFNPVSLPDNPVASYNEVDREVVRGLECYLALPRHRRDLSIFRYETLPQPLRDKMSSQYPQERPDWYPVVWERLKTYASKIIQSDQRLPQPPPTFESFRAQAVACIDEIAKLPHKGWPPNYFVTTLKEREYLLSEVVPRLHTILREEFERTNRDIATGKEAERRRLGYKGPIGGIPLSLKYGLMDHIVRIRQRETHRANLARARKIPIAEVTIPDDYGRSYARGDRFPTLVQVRDELLKVRSRRCVHLIFKELDGFHAEEIAPENVVKRYEERMIESCAVGHALSQEFASRYKEKNALRHEARVDLDLFLGLETRFQKRLQQHHLELEDLKLTETREMTQLGAARKSGMIEKNVLERAREGFQNQREQHQQARMHTLRSLLWLYQAKLPPDKFITGAPYAILDEELVRFIISIGGDDQIRITPEAIDSEGTHKHTHSEHLGGKNMYAGGEQIFARHKVFSLSLNAWLKFNATLQKEGPLPFKPMDLNDLSGHYEPPFSTLLYARNKIFPALAQLGFSLAKCHVIDRVATGVALQEDESIFT
jgi:hypothetical protein